MATQYDLYQLRELASSIASLQSGMYSDFTIRCSDNTVIRAHRAVVCPRSRVLSATMDGKFKEGMSNEVYLEDDDSDIVKNMVDFLYTTDYNDFRSVGEMDLDRKASGLPGAPDAFEMKPDESDESEEDSFIPFGPRREKSPENSTVNRLEYNPQALITNAKTYIIADKNGIEALKKLATTKYEQVVLKCWNECAFAESARLIYENTMETDRTIRDIIAKTASVNIKALLDRGEFVEMLNSCGELATDILKREVASSKPVNGFDLSGFRSGRGRGRK